MTDREQQILALLKQDPLISQQSLADIVGISRSAVAGHIMNMTNKGIIQGKGYILADSEYAVVVGGANMDILGRPNHNLLQGDSNPGTVSCSAGGVGRNIAENLARLGSDTRLISAIGKDTYGQDILRQCRQANIDMQATLQLSDANTSTYLSVLDGDNDMHVAIADMAILERLTPEVLLQQHAILQRANLIIVDANLSDDALQYLFSNYADKPLFFDTVSSAKAKKILPYLSAIHTLKPNIKEAQELSGISYHNHDDLPRLAAWFHEQGVNRIFLSLGAEGVFFSDNGHQGLMAPVKVEILNANGAGDAFLAGLAHSYLKQWSIEQATQFAIAAAAIALNHVATINPNMSEISVNRILKESVC